MIIVHNSGTFGETPILYGFGIIYIKIVGDPAATQNWFKTQPSSNDWTEKQVASGGWSEKQAVSSNWFKKEDAQ